MSRDTVWDRMAEKRPLSVGEWLAVYVPSAAKAFREFRIQCRITPALRERCLNRVIDLQVANQRAGVDGAWGLAREAEALARYIAEGKAP